MTTINLFPESESQIILNIPGREEPLVLDALDIDNMLSEFYLNTDNQQPSIPEVMAGMVDLFEQKYGFRMSKSSMDALLKIKKEKLDEVKKNSFPVSKPASSTESSPKTKESS